MRLRAVHWAAYATGITFACACTVAACDASPSGDNDDSNDASVSNDSTVVADSQPTPHDADVTDVSQPLDDAGAEDAALNSDAEPLDDANVVSDASPTDSSDTFDGTVAVDSGVSDAGPADDAGSDATVNDAGVADSGVADSGVQDSGVPINRNRLALTSTSACAITSTGKVKCWGNNQYGQLGDGTLAERLGAVEMSGVSNAEALTSGIGHTCALTGSGDVYCVGYNASGQLGDGTKSNRNVPQKVALPAMRKVVAGLDYTYGITSSGQLKVWGDTSRHQALPASYTAGSTTLTPSDVAGLANLADVTGGESHTCFIRDNGSVECWGENTFGQLGLGDGAHYHAAPGILTALTAGSISDVACKVQYQSCVALTTVGGLKVWGDNSGGELGAGASFTTIQTPKTISIATPVVAIVPSRASSYLLLSDGRVQASGGNNKGQLGDGTKTDRKTFGFVSGINNAIAIAAADFHACAMLADESVVCWGGNFYGQLGNGTKIDSTAPVKVVAFP